MRLVLPTLRVCPPMTMRDMDQFSVLSCGTAYRYCVLGTASLPQPRQHRQLLQIPPQGARRRAPKHHAWTADCLLGEHAALRAQDHTLFDAGVVPDAHLPANHGAILHGDAAGEAGLGGDDHIFSDADIVAHVHQIIQLRAPADDGQVQSSAIHGGISADLHVVADLQAANLRKLFVAAGGGVAHVAEAVAAQHRAAVHENTVAQTHPGIDCHMGSDIALPAHADLGTNYAAGANAGAVADYGLLANDHAWLNSHMSTQPGGIFDDGGGVNSRLKRARRAQELGGPDKGQLGRAHNQ